MPSNSQRLSTQQNLSQKQVVTQKLIQSIKLMAMPLPELRETIMEEVEKNPALEVVRDGGETELPAEMPVQPQAQSVTDPDPFADSSDSGYQYSGSSGDADSKQQFLEGAVFREESLGDHLSAQLGMLDLPEKVKKLAEQIIWNLDENGFHREDPALLPGGDDTALLETALETVQSLDPAGCACFDWKESLLVQARVRGDGPENFDLYVNKALPLLEKRKKPEEIMDKLQISPEDWEDFEEYIRMLTPFPGRMYSSDKPRYIIPDLIVRKVEGEYVLILNDEVLPVLRVDPEFEKMKDIGNGDKETRRFVSGYSRDAKYFINSLKQRENTLLKTAKAIIEFQRDFFSGGPRFLKPLTLKDIADEIGVHEATVSRITTNKYIQTDWGLFELKFFFSNSVSGSGSSGSRVSKVAAKEVIKEILAEAKPGEKISDQKLSELLARRGINIARRTVAKYRKELDLPSSYNR